MRNLATIKKHLILCNGEQCTIKGANKIIESIRRTIKRCGLHDHIHTTRSLCNGRCEDGSIVIIYPDAVWYKNVDETAADKIVKKHLMNGQIVKENLLFKQETKNHG
jgi:(2Fe-2S) ferredoxin